MPSAPPPRWAASACWSARRETRPPPVASPTLTPSTPGSKRRPRVADLSLWPIGNCQVSALVDAAAGLVWGCAPRVDGDPLFCALLSPREEGEAARGEWRIALENQVKVEQSYL